MLELPICRWRGETTGPGRHDCRSPKLVVGALGVPDSRCESCYCRDHVPIVQPARPGRCTHLGRRARDESGEIVRRLCGPCGGKMLDVFACDHPGTADDVTLYDCGQCPYRPEQGETSEMMTVFERVYLINLKTRPDRLINFRRFQELKGWRLPEPILFPAIAGDVVGVPNYFTQGAGAWGCLRSHCRILEDCLMEGVQSVLILEDDVEWMSDAWERLKVHLVAVPPDWSQLMLGGQHIQPPDPVCPGVVRVRNCQRTHAYAIRGAAIKSLLRAWYSSAVHCDWVMGNDWQRSWPVYAADPMIFGQGGGKSDVSGRLNNDMYWRPPTNAPVIVLDTTPDVAAVLRSHGLHMGFKRDADGVDLGLAAIAKAGFPTEKFRDWLSTLLWEVASMEGAVTTIYWPGVSLQEVRNLHTWEVRYVCERTVEACLRQLTGLNLIRNYSSTHVLLLRADRQTVEALAGFHRGFWFDDATGHDRGQQDAVAGDKVAGLVKWMKHAGEEAERMRSVPLVWHPEISREDVAAAFPDREVVELAAASAEQVHLLWSEYVGQGTDGRRVSRRRHG